MYTEFEIEKMDEQRRAPLTRIEKERIEAIQEWEESQPSLRSRIALGLITLGKRIDPKPAPAQRRHGRLLIN